MTTPYGPDQRYPQMPPPGRQPQGYGPPAVGGPPPLLQAVVYLGPPAYEIVMIAQWGATFGKRWMGLRVVRMANGQAPGFGVALVRFLIPAVGALACGIGALVVYASPLFDKSVAKQGWHDMAAKTMVIKVR